MDEKNKKPDPLELSRLLIQCEKATGKEKAAKFREAADEARAWASWHNRRSLDLLNLQEVSDGHF